MNEHVHGLSRSPRVLVTRATGQASALAEELARLGAEPVNVPTIEVVPPDSFAALDAALASVAAFDWILFTSANAVSAVAARLNGRNLALSFAGKKIAAVGPATARALESIGLRVDLIPPTAVAESLASALVPFVHQTDGNRLRFLLLRAQEGREHLPETLREAGAEVMVAAAYKTRVPAEAVSILRDCFLHGSAQPDALTLTSSSAARNFFALLQAAKLNLRAATAVVSIGPITSETLRELGHPPDVESPEANVKALAETTMNFLRRRSLRDCD